jgi:hypothetical protein
MMATFRLAFAGAVGGGEEQLMVKANAEKSSVAAAGRRTLFIVITSFGKAPLDNPPGDADVDALCTTKKGGHLFTPNCARMQ